MGIRQADPETLLQPHNHVHLGNDCGGRRWNRDAGALRGTFSLKGWFWSAIVKLNENFGSLGYIIVGLFLLSGVVSIAVYKFDNLELGV